MPTCDVAYPPRVLASVECRAGRARHPRFIFPTQPRWTWSALRRRSEGVLVPSDVGRAAPATRGLSFKPTRRTWSALRRCSEAVLVPSDVGRAAPATRGLSSKPTRRTWSALRRCSEAVLVPSDVGRAAPATRGSFSQPITAAFRSRVGSVRPLYPPFKPHSLTNTAARSRRACTA